MQIRLLVYDLGSKINYREELITPQVACMGQVFIYSHNPRLDHVIFMWSYITTWYMCNILWLLDIDTMFISIIFSQQISLLDIEM